MIKARFTLIEVVVALAILTLGILAGMSLMAASRERAMKAANQWKQQHIMTQAMEYFMLTDGRDGIPEEFFPYKDYAVSCEYSNAEGLNDISQTPIPGWKLITMNVSLRNSSGTVIRKLSVDRIVKEGDL